MRREGEPGVGGSAAIGAGTPAGQVRGELAGERGELGAVTGADRTDDERALPVQDEVLCRCRGVQAGQFADRIRIDVFDRLADIDPDPVGELTCLYTSTPTEDFILDRQGPFVVCSACSGHGAKIAPLTGEFVADLARGGPALHSRGPSWLTLATADTATGDPATADLSSPPKP